MSTTNTTFTVENLVAKYINFVAEAESKKNEDGFPGIPGEPEKQLLITLYNAVAGEGADSDIQEALSQQAKEYLKDAFSEEEFRLLCEHFCEASSICFSHLEKTYACMPSDKEVEYVKTFVKPAAGSTVYVAVSGYCEIAALFSGCIIKGFTDYDYENASFDKETWALGQIRLFSKGIKSEIRPSSKGCADESYLEDVDYVVWDASDSPQLFGAEMVYRRLGAKAKLLFFMDKQYAAGQLDEKDIPDNRREAYELRKALVEDETVESILSYDRIEFEEFRTKMVLLLVDKSGKSFVSIGNSLNGSSIEISSRTLECDCLWPSYYMTVRPSNGVSLSELADFKELEKPKKVLKDGAWEFTEKFMNMPVIIPSKMAREYKDANLSYSVSYFGDGSFPNAWRYAARVINEPCVLLYGSREQYFAGYVRELPDTGLSTFRNIACLIPKQGIDVRYVTALLFSSEVKNQIIGICDGEITSSTLPLILKKVIVPNHTDKERLAFLSEANYEAIISSQKDLKKEKDNYVKAVRRRKHALTQSFAAMEATFYALNSHRVRQNGKLSDEDVISRVTGISVRDAFEQMSSSFKNLMPALEHIAELEYSFAKSEWINPKGYIEDYISKHIKGWRNFVALTKWNQGTNAISHKIKGTQKGDLETEIEQIFFPKDALESVLNNIVANAVSHGFIDEKRQDYKLRFSIQSDGVSLSINVENNGEPIPSDRDTDSLLEYGVSTKLHQDGHNGIGCNEIDDIMRRYDGRVKIVSTPDDTFTVKYILTFYNSNISQQKNDKDERHYS